MSEETFDKEIRFAVVMYGGVSLSIYINGVAQELLRMVRATAPADGDPLTLRYRFRADELSGTERVYRAIGGALGVRFVVDILSGTSAGGINSLFLAKALVQNRSLDDLKQLWIEEGDIGRLLNDRRSLEGLPADLLDDPPESLLNGLRFYRKLLDALDSMDDENPLPLPASTVAREPASPYVDQLDLYITATDFDGVKKPIQLADKTIVEPDHRKRFHFRYEDQAPNGATVNDLRPELNPMLAFAARCTASFPAAFPPFRLKDIDRVLDSHHRYENAPPKTRDLQQWKRFFEGYPDQTFADRYFVDGGYLDNKPFDAAIEALAEWTRPLLPVDRKLVFVEPHPDVYSADRERDRPPDLVSNLVAVAALPRVETIRGQLEELDRRNRIIRRAAILTAGVEEDLRVSPTARTPQIPASLWALDDLRVLTTQYGLPYGGYHRLKVARLADWIGRLVDGNSSTTDGTRYASESSRQLLTAWLAKSFVRYYDDDEAKIWKDLRAPLVEAVGAAEPTAEQRALRDKLAAADASNDPRATFGLAPTENRFLVDFDLSYRLRRVAFERLKLRGILESSAQARSVLLLGQQPASVVDVVATDKAWRDAHQELVGLQGELQRIDAELREIAEAATRAIAPQIATLRDLAEQLEEIYDFADSEGIDRDDPTIDLEIADVAKRVDACLSPLRAELRQRFMSVGAKYDALVKGAATHPIVGLVRSALDHFHDRYSEFDQVRFTVLYTMGTEELAPVDVVRISAADTTLAGDRGAEKLAGVRLGHFGAFLDPAWRKNDILWGRLDCAERLITMLVPGNEPLDTARREQWLVDASVAIIGEELTPYTKNEARVQDLARRLARALRDKRARPAGGSPPDPNLPPAQLDSLVESAVELVQDTQWAKIEEQQGQPEIAKPLIEAYLAERTKLRPLETDTALRLVGRATLVVRGMIDALAVRRGNDGQAGVKWLLRLFTVFWGLVELAVPGTVRSLLRHALSVVILAGVLIAGVGIAFGRNTEIAIGALLAAGAVVLQLAGVALRALATRRTTRLVLAAATSFVVGACLAARFVGERAKIVAPAGWPEKRDFALARSSQRLASIIGYWRNHHALEAIRASLWWDYAFIGTYAAFVVGVALFLRELLRRGGWQRAAKLATVVIGLTALAAVCDATENLLLLRELAKPVSCVVPLVTFGVTTVKFGALTLVCVATIVMIVPSILSAVSLVTRWLRRTFSASQGGSSG